MGRVFAMRLRLEAEFSCGFVPAGVVAILQRGNQRVKQGFFAEFTAVAGDLQAALHGLAADYDDHASAFV